jgi:hypothetical protein
MREESYESNVDARRHDTMLHKLNFKDFALFGFFFLLRDSTILDTLWEGVWDSGKI